MGVILVGFMGAGKTTVGAALAQQSQLPQYDLDHLIETRVGQSIPAFFATAGEADFRQLEAQVLQQTMTLDGIISTGGGIVMTAASRQLLLQATQPVVYLHTSLEEISRRLVGNQNRPLFNETDPASLKRLFDRRLALYRQVADIEVQTDQQDPTALAMEIMAQVSHPDQPAVN